MGQILQLFEHFRRSKHVALLFKLGLSIIAFWLAFESISFSSLYEVIQQQELTGLAEAVVLMIFQTLLGGLRWRQVLIALSKAGEYVMSMKEALKLYYISVFFNCCLPGTVGGDVVRVWLAKSEHVPLPLAINSVVIDRLVALLALAVLVAATLPSMGRIIGFDATWALPVVLLLGVAGIWLLLRIERLLQPHAHIRIAHWLLYFINCLRMLFRRPGMFALSLSYSIVAHLSFCLSCYMLAKSLNADITVLESITLIPLVMLAIILPISIGGWGVREASMVGMLGLIGVAQEQAVMIGIELGFLSILLSSPAGLLWLVYKRQVKQPVAGNMSLQP